MGISVFLQEQDHLSEVPRHSTTRTRMDEVLGMNLAAKIGQNAIKLLSGLTWKEVKECARTGLRPVIRKSYIPEKMPPLNVPNTKFVEPQSVTWKLQHRNADEFFQEQEAQ